MGIYDPRDYFGTGQPDPEAAAKEAAASEPWEPCIGDRVKIRLPKKLSYGIYGETSEYIVDPWYTTHGIADGEMGTIGGSHPEGLIVHFDNKRRLIKAMPFKKEQLDWMGE